MELLLPKGLARVLSTGISMNVIPGLEERARGRILARNRVPLDDIISSYFFKNMPSIPVNSGYSTRRRTAGELT